MDKSYAETADSSWKSLYKVGGTTALIVVLLALLDCGIVVLSGGATGLTRPFPCLPLPVNTRLRQQSPKNLC